MDLFDYSGKVRYLGDLEMVIEHEVICMNLYLSAKQNYAAQHRNVYLDAVSGDPYSKLVSVWLEVTKSYFLGKLIQKH